jgi:hypothetical protein
MNKETPIVIKMIMEDIVSIEDLQRVQEAASLRIIELSRQKKKEMFVDNDISSPMMTNEQYIRSKSSGREL